MRLLDLLDDLELGHDAAENDVVLDKAFVETQAFVSLINDEADLVTGLKGTGKTALYRMLTEHKDQVPQLAHTHVVRASNPTGSPIFRSLFTEQATEARLRSIWIAYFAFLVSRTVVEQHLGTPSVRRKVEDINEIVELLGFSEAAAKPKNLLQRIRDAKSIEPTVTTDTSGTLLSFGLRFEVADAVSPHAGVDLELTDFLGLLKSCNDVLAATGERVWIAVDRLDECFLRDSEVERRALRALLRTQLDICSELGLRRHVGLKIFLRTDLLRRMTSDVTFTNSTHLRTIELQWSERDIQNIVGSRVLRSHRFNSVWPECDKSSRPARAAWDHLLPHDLNWGDKTSLHQICTVTADGHRGYNPRNVLALLRISVDRLRETERATPSSQIDFKRPILSESVLKSSLGKLSRRRLTDTVLNEFTGVDLLVAALERKPPNYGSRDELLETLGLSSQPKPVQDGAIDLLLLSGVLGQSGAGYFVPHLYRAAVKTLSPNSGRRVRRTRVTGTPA